MSNISPIFSKVLDSNAYSVKELRVNRDHSGPKEQISITIENINLDLCSVVNSLEEAETQVLSSIPVEEITITNSLSDLVISILRRSNGIASKSRRSFGNIVIMNDSLFQKFKNSENDSLEKFISPINEERYGRWTFKAMLTNHVRIFTGDSIPEDEIAIMYNSSQSFIDGACGLIKKDDDLLLYMLSSKNQGDTYFPDYVARLKVTFS